MRRKVAVDPVRREQPLQEKEESIDAGKLIVDKTESAINSSRPAISEDRDMKEAVKSVNGGHSPEQQDTSANDIQLNNT